MIPTLLPLAPTKCEGKKRAIKLSYNQATFIYLNALLYMVRLYDDGIPSLATS